MQKWEYRVVSLRFSPPQIEDALNRLGTDGWELVVFVSVYDSGEATAYLKRPKVG